MIRLLEISLSMCLLRTVLGSAPFDLALDNLRLDALARWPACSIPTKPA